MGVEPVGEESGPPKLSDVEIQAKENVATTGGKKM